MSPRRGPLVRFADGAIASVLITFLLAGLPQSPMACSCYETESQMPLADFRALAPSIFLAQVIDVHGPFMIPEGTNSFRFEHDRWFRMRTVASWKGDVPDTVVVRTGSGGGNCGYAFAVGGLYLVYAWGEGDSVRTGICSRTRPWTSAHEDSMGLGKPEVDRTGGRGWIAFAPPLTCPVHVGTPVRRDRSAVIYGMPGASERRYRALAAKEFPYASIQLEIARADSARTGGAEAYICAACQERAMKWCIRQPHARVSSGWTTDDIQGPTAPR